MTNNEETVTQDEIQNEEIAEEETQEAEPTGEKKTNEDVEKLKKEVGFLKRLLSKKDKKEEEKPVEKTEKSDEEFGLLELTYLKGEDIKNEDEVDFVKKELKEAGLKKDQLPKLFANKYFKAQLEEFKSEKANEKATSDVKGGRGTSEAKNKPEYWIAKGVPPTREQVPDRKDRVVIAKAMLDNQKSGKKFYNE